MRRALDSFGWSVRSIVAAAALGGCERWDVFYSDDEGRSFPTTMI